MQSRQTRPFYRPSGSFSPLGLAMAMSVGLAATVVCAGIYGGFTAFNPFIYVNIMAPFLFGMGIGGALRVGSRWGKNRSPVMAVLMSLCLSAVGYYLSWVIWLDVMLPADPDSTWVLDPMLLAAYLAVAAESGVWSLEHFTPTGMVLYGIWALEALIILGIPAYIVWDSVMSTPFSEARGEWADRVLAQTQKGPVYDTAALRQALLDGEFDVLEGLGTSQGGDQLTEMTLTGCQNFDQEGFLSVHKLRFVVNKDGKPEEKRDAIVDRLVLDAAGFERVSRILNEDRGKASSSERRAA